MIISFRWGLLEKMGVTFFMEGERGLGVQFLHKSKLKSEIFKEKKSLTKIVSAVNLNSEFSYF